MYYKIYKMLMKIDEAIAAEYAELKLQGNIRKRIDDLFRKIRFGNPDLAKHVRKRMMEIAKKQGDL